MVQRGSYAASNSTPARMAWGAAEKADLLLRLYERAVSCMVEAIKLMDAGDMVGKGRSLIRAQDIAMELMDALDARSGGSSGYEIARNLRRLYAYVYRKLIEGNRTQSREPILEAQRIMLQLYHAWRQITPDFTTTTKTCARARL